MNTSHVLIVDDEPAIRDSLHWLLEDAGYVVHEAANGLAAVEVLAASAMPLIVLFDLKMSGMSGYEFVRLLAGQPAWAARHAFIVMTAMSARGLADVMPLLQRLCITVVSKPFDIDDILAAVTAEMARLQAVPVHEAG